MMGTNLEAVKKYLFRLLIVLVAIVFLVAGFMAVSQFRKTKAPGYKPVPEKNLFSVNAEILKIDTAAKKISAKALVPPDWKKEWTLVISDETRIGTYDSWRKAVVAKQEAEQQGLKPAEQESKFKEQFKNLALADLKIGDVIYVTADYDFVKRVEIPKVTAVLLQSVKK